MEVCLNKKCCDGNEKKKAIISVNVNNKNIAKNELIGKEKSITLDENLLNQNSKYIINKYLFKKM